jgi:hypothetical protein
LICALYRASGNEARVRSGTALVTPDAILFRGMERRKTPTKDTKHAK